MANELRTRDGLPFNFVDGLRIKGVDVTNWDKVFIDQGASYVGFTPVGNLAASNVQAAIAELESEKQSKTEPITTAINLRPGANQGIVWDNDAFGGTQDTASITLETAAGEATKMRFKMTNDSDDNFEFTAKTADGLTAFNNAMTLNGNVLLNAANYVDYAAPMISDYTALRAYTGSASQVRITTNGLAGFFYYDAADTTSADNGGTIIVSSNGKRWKRLFDGAVNVKWFGAKGDWNGVSGADDTSAIQAAINHVNGNGGGVLIFPSGTYKIATTTSDGHISSHFNLTNMEDISLVGYGATLQSVYSAAARDNAGALFNCNGCRRVNFEGFDISGVFARILSTVSDYSVGAFYLRSSDRDGESISIKNIRAQNVYFFIRTGETTVGGPRVRNILSENCLAVNGYYGLNFQQNGDNFTAINFRTYNFIRSYFLYGVDTHNVQYASYNGDVFTDCLIKAYALDTKNITVSARIIGNTSNDAKCSIETQHSPSTQPVPAKLLNININFDDTNSTGAKSLRFAYFQDTPTPTEPGVSEYNLFNNIVISGYARNSFDVGVTQQVAGRLNVDDLIPALPSSGVFNGKGFIRTQESGTWTPVLVDDSLNPTEGQTASLALGKYEKIGNVVYFTGRLHMSSLGTLNSTAAAAIIGLPYASNPQASLNNCVTFGQASNLNMASASVVTGVIPENTTRINLRKWSATTGTAGLAVSEVTASGQLIFSGSYIV